MHCITGDDRDGAQPCIEMLAWMRLLLDSGWKKLVSSDQANGARERTIERSSEQSMQSSDLASDRASDRSSDRATEQPINQAIERSRDQATKTKIVVRAACVRLTRRPMHSAYFFITKSSGTLLRFKTIE